MRPVIGITMGDPAGIGPELCLRVWREPSVLARCVPVLFGDLGVLQRIPKSEPAISGGRVLSLAEWQQHPALTGPALVNCAAIEPGSFQPGQVSSACGRAAFTYLEHAIAAALTGRLAGVVTAPIHKEALRLAGVKYPGHTEIFAALTGARRACMMLRSDVLTVSLVTTHVGYAEVPAKLSVGRVLEVIELTTEALQRMKQQPPRIGVCGLNPHAGEHGLFGNEEEQFVAPAITQARAKGIQVEGPLVPDAVFTPAQRKRFDAIVCLYHDQGHIPFKMLAFETGVNITLGLPIIRTSVDHGTAFDIAWQGVANPSSLLAAIHAAVDLSQNQSSHSASP